MVVSGVIGTALSILQNSLILFLFLGSEVSYIIVFPQLVCVLLFRVSNGYGSVMGWLVGCTLRLLFGEPSLGLNTVMRFLGCTAEDGVYSQCAPVKTISMLSAVAAILFFSFLASFLFNKGLLPEKWDVFKAKVQPMAPSGGPKDDKMNGKDDENDFRMETSEPMLNSAVENYE